MAETPQTWCAPEPPPPPAAPGPLLITPDLSNLCSVGWRRRLITGLLRDVLIRHFAAPTNVQELNLRQYVWQDSLQTGILIEAIGRSVPDLVEKRPAIIIKANARKSTRFGIADKTGTDERGRDLYCKGWVGSHTVFCLNNTSAASDILADEVEREITEFAPALIQYLGLLACSVTSVEATGEVEESKESFVTPVVVGWAYQHNWALEMEALPLRRIQLSTLIS